jgi:hypothetical protein
MGKFVKAEVNEVREYWSCMNDECKEYNKASVMVNPDWYMNNGTPVCDECDTDMCFDHVEVFK